MIDTQNLRWPRTRRLLEHRRLPMCVMLLALVLCIPGLFAGLSGDDHLHRAALLGVPGYPEVKRPPGEMFAFIRNEQEVIRDRARGVLPWWTASDLHVAFWRPLSGWLHWLDWHAWPNRPALMHTHSLVWLAIAVFAAAGLYRRLLGPTWVAGLAAVLFAVDDAHGTPAIWLANRNSMVALALGLLALRAYHDARSGDSRMGSWIAPLLLGLALLANEGAVAIVGYMAAHAVFLETGSWWRRVKALLPGVAVMAAWLTAYKLGGYGVHGCSMYIDPIGDTGRFIQAAAQHLPLLLWGQWMTPPAELCLMMSHGAMNLFVIAAVLFAFVMGWLLLPLVRRDPVTRFFAAGMLLAMVPVCATVPQDRLLQFVGIGGVGLIAQLLGGAADRASWLPVRQPVRMLTRGLVWMLLVVHLVIAPIHLAATGPQYHKLGEMMDAITAGLPADPRSRHQQWIVVHAPSAFFTIFTPVIRAMDGGAAPTRMSVLSAGIHGAEIERRDANTLRIRLPGGFLPPPGTPPPNVSANAIDFDLNYLCQGLDLLFRRVDKAFSPGDKVALPGIDVTIMKVTSEGRAAEVEYRFERPLENSGYRWLTWTNRGTFEEFVLPAIGETRTLAPARLAIP